MMTPTTPAEHRAIRRFVVAVYDSVILALGPEAEADARRIVALVLRHLDDNDLAVVRRTDR